MLTKQSKMRSQATLISSLNKGGSEQLRIMKKWLSSYKGDSEYPGNAIPLYSGTELYIKKEYIEMLEKQFGTLMMKTCVKTYTQDYQFRVISVKMSQ